MAENRVGIIMNGVTGRMGTHQHLLRSIAAIIKQGGVVIKPGEVIVPDPILVGRNPAKLKKICELSAVEKWSTDVDACLGDSNYPIYFDAQTTALRAQSLRKAIKAAKHIYCEKPTATDTETAIELYKSCRDAGLKNGVVQDKLWLPGIIKLKGLIENEFFGKILSVRGEFGYWVFEGHSVTAQRPSWNYRKEDGGGIVFDMMPHWHYLLDNLFGSVKAVSCLAATHIAERIDENEKPYPCTAEDAAYATFELEGGVIAHFNASWATRVRRDDLLTLQVDGTKGSAVAGLHACYFQSYGNTPKPVWNPDIAHDASYLDDWSEVPGEQKYDNAFRAEWELFLRHVACEEPFQWNLLEGAKGVQLAQKATESWKQRCWMELPDLMV